jgi:hypothetical protein
VTACGVRRAACGFPARQKKIIFFCAVLLGPVGCGGTVPEQALRDEQARMRQYRDAYETTAAELAAAKARLAALEKSCSAAR